MKILSEKKYVFTLLVLFLSISLNLFADTTYKVEKGDTLYSISRKYQITVAELRAANNLSESDIIKIGQKLIIPKADISTAAALATDNSKKTSETPAPTTTVTTTKETKNTVYIVEKGDTLYGIAKKTGVSVAEIVSLNNIDTSSVIKVGQKLKLVDTTEKISSAKPEQDKPKTTTPASEKKQDPVSEPKKEVTISVTEEKVPDTRTYGDTVSSDSSTIWPVKNPKVTAVKGKVSGVQLSAQMNETVNCIREGTVMYVGVYRGFGQVVFVQSKTGMIYAYAGLGSVKVKKSDYVNSGNAIGTAGIDSISGKPQITFMVFQNGQPIDPAKAPRN